MSNSQIEMFTIRRRIALHAIVSVLLVSGCANSQLGVDPDYQWVGGRTYTANIKMLQAYSKCELPTCDAARHGEFTVVDSNIEDLRRPLKMVVASGVEMKPVKEWDVEQGWELYLYHVVPNTEHGVEVVTTVCKSNYGRFEPIHRKEVIKYVKENESDECKEWRNWAVTTNYNELAKRAPHIMFGQEFSDMIRADVLDPINDAQKTCGYDDMSLDAARRLSSEALIHLLRTDDRDVPGVNGFSDVSSGDLIKAIERLQGLDIIELCGANTMIESSNGDQTYAYRVRNALNNPFSGLRNMASSALSGPKARSQAFDIVKEMSERIAAKKIALKKKLDDEAELARIEKERLAEEKRVAEEKRKREEAEKLRRMKASDQIAVERMESQIEEWRSEHSSGIEKILSASDPIAELAIFSKGTRSPRIDDYAEKLQLSENRAWASSITTRWKEFETMDWEAFASKPVLERVKRARSLKEICDCIDEKVWKVILKYCADVEQQSNDEALFLALKNGDEMSVTKAISGCVTSLNRMLCIDGSKKWTPLTYAAMRGNCSAIRQLVAKGADVNYVDELSNTPIGQAAWSGQVRAIQELITLGASIRSSPISAVRNGQLDAVKFFVEKVGMSVNTLYDGEISPRGFLLGEAVSSGQVDVCRYLVEKGCDVNYRPKTKKGGNYYSAIEMAVICKNIEMLSYLKSTGRVSEFYDAVGLAKKSGDGKVIAFINGWLRESEQNLSGLCGVKFGVVDMGGNTIGLGKDKGLLSKQFVPEKMFDEFDECYCLSTPKSHRVCKIYLVKSMIVGWGGSPDQLDDTLQRKYLSIKPILERKYRSRCLRWYPWTMKNNKTGRKEEVGIGFEFPNGTLDCSIADKDDLKDLYGGLAWMGRALLIVATDKNLFELGKREAEEIEKEKARDSADAL